MQITKQKIERKTLTWLLLPMLVLVLSGCQPVTVEEPLTGELAGGDGQSQMEFWHALAGRHVVSNDEGFHALLLFFDDEDVCENYEQRVEVLKERGALPGSFDQAGAEALDYGDLAVVLTKELKIKGGVTLGLFPYNARYASRELRYLGIYPPSTANQIISGGDFVAMIGVVEDYQRLHPSRPLSALRASEVESEIVDTDVIDGDQEQGEAVDDDTLETVDPETSEPDSTQ